MHTIMVRFIIDVRFATRVTFDSDPYMITLQAEYGELLSGTIFCSLSKTATLRMRQHHVRPY